MTCKPPIIIIMTAAKMIHPTQPVVRVGRFREDCGGTLVPRPDVELVLLISAPCLSLDRAATSSSVDVAESMTSSAWWPPVRVASSSRGGTRGGRGRARRGHVPNYRGRMTGRLANVALLVVVVLATASGLGM